ncbi:hypothetical protein Cadr_000029200 [Camelus dromedarius]|uniref:Uncharacterized protein n=1 Tax=Camelus dromedarius TaxID=9838 RepID=A0A5N4C681_CAMDR|nr:hypothetical protein Cadr_000029200 [Camelus dromedarius]
MCRVLKKDSPRLAGMRPGSSEERVFQTRWSSRQDTEVLEGESRTDEEQ